MRAILLAAAAVLPFAAPAAAQQGGVFFCTVASATAIYDADTFRCADRTKVRVWGVNARERDEPGGREARDFARRLFGGVMLACEKRGKSYDRIVARCVLPSGVDIAEELVRAGAAWDCGRYSQGAYADIEPEQPSEPTEAHHRMCDR